MALVGDALDLPLIGAEGEAEHVGSDLPADTLGVELSGELQEDLIGDVSQRRARSARRCQLGDEDGGLPHHGVDEKLDVQGVADTRRGDERG